MRHRDHEHRRREHGRDPEPASEVLELGIAVCVLGRFGCAADGSDAVSERLDRLAYLANGREPGQIFDADVRRAEIERGVYDAAQLTEVTLEHLGGAGRTRRVVDDELDACGAGRPVARVAHGRDEIAYARAY